MELLESRLCCGGEQRRYQHQSQVLDCGMRFSLFVPPLMRADTPVLFWLSGLSCTDENFVLKAGAQRWAATQGLALLTPDTSPRGKEVSNASDYSLGQGAGFYLDATEKPWSRHFKMESYISAELPQLLVKLGFTASRYGICGHSMGGHGALTLFLRHPQLFTSVSALSPIANPSATPWGQQAMRTYLGDDQLRWQQHDAYCLLSQTKTTTPIRIDIGLLDEYWKELQVLSLIDAARLSGARLDLQIHGGYDHSYYFIASFIEQHIRFHSSLLS